MEIYSRERARERARRDAITIALLAVMRSLSGDKSADCVDREQWGRGFLSLSQSHSHSNVVARLTETRRAMSSASSSRPAVAAAAAGPSRPRSPAPRVWAILEPLSDAARSALQASSPNRVRYLECTTDRSTYRVGRSAENDLALRTQAGKISSHHATLERITSGAEDEASLSQKKKKKALAKLEDSSRNGTSINGTKVRGPSLSLFCFFRRL